MGHIKNIANQPKIQTFPSSTFEIADTVPAAQCSEAKIEGTDATTQAEFPPALNHVGAFTGYNLSDKNCHIITNPGGNTGDFYITGNTNDRVALQTTPGNGGPTAYYIEDGGGLILTRDIQSFADFIHAAGYAYTIKGGKLYTNIPSNLLQPACSILFDPLT